MTLNDDSDKKLFRLKNDFMGYRACPRCGNALKKKFVDGRTRLVCSGKECHYIYYHNPIPAAGALVIQNNKILLVKRAVSPKKGWWCIPAGFMEWDEHPSETAVREVREETGLDIKLKSLFEVYSGNDDPRMNAVLILYLADTIGGELKPSDDAQDVGFYNFDNLPDQIAFKSNNQAIADYKERYLSN
jgi:ADP-ribose pyrophosphatase YjhB (NUDIX family)